MEEAKNILSDQIEKLVDKEDVEGLDQLVQNLDAGTLLQYKTEIIDAWLNIFFLWSQDLYLGKVKKEDEETVVASLFEIISSVEKIEPGEVRYTLRAGCYEQLSEIKTEPEEKLQCIQKAIDEYTTGLLYKPTADMQARLAGALLNRMQITQQFTEEGFTEVLQLFQHAFTAYSETVFSSFLHGCFQLLHFPFKDNHHWHFVFMKQLEASLTQFAGDEPIIYLTWSDELARIFEYEKDTIEKEYASALNRRSIELLEPLINYETENNRRLNGLGHAFEKAAHRMEMNATVQKLHYYEIALKYYLKGQQLSPAEWTFPVYATNVQMAMAHIYNSVHNKIKVIALFEAGKVIFSTTGGYGKDFTLHLYWGEFLIEYARLAYNFNAPDILKEAESKLLIAKEHGRNFYSQPYIALAKVALKLGDEQQCLDILQECGAVFTTEYYKYEYSEVLKDEDFKEIWQQVGR